LDSYRYFDQPLLKERLVAIEDACQKWDDLLKMSTPISMELQKTVAIHH
jgi:hypothetical protein